MNRKPVLSILALGMERGGAEMVIHNLLKNLRGDYEIHLTLLLDKFHFEIPDGIEVHFLAKKDYGGIKNILRLSAYAKAYKKLLVEIKADVSLSYLERPNFVACLAKMFGSKVPVLVTVSASLATWYPKNTLMGKTGRTLIKWLYPKANLVIPCSKYIGYELATDFQIPKAVFYPLYNGIDIEEIQVQARKPLAEQKKLFWFVHLGSFYEVKNHKLLIDSFAAFNRSNPGVANLKLMGKGHLLVSIRDYVEELGLSNLIDVIGYAENPYNVIAAADCFVLSSNFEGLPTVVLEALACGTAVISTDCRSGPREILAPEIDFKNQIQEGIEVAEWGTLVPVKDTNAMAAAMQYAFDNRGSRKKDYEAALHKFSLPVFLNNIKEVIEKIR